MTSQYPQPDAAGASLLGSRLGRRLAARETPQSLLRTHLQVIGRNCGRCGRSALSPRLGRDELAGRYGLHHPQRPANRHDQGGADGLCLSDMGRRGGGRGCGRAYCRSATTRPSADTLAGTRRRLSSFRRPAYWSGQTRDVNACVRSCEVSQPAKAEKVGPCGQFHPLPLPSRRGGVIRVDRLLGLPMTTSTRRRRKSTSSPERHGRDGGRGADHASPARGTGCRLRWLLTTTPSPPAPWSRISRRIDSSLLLAFWLGPFHQHQHLARAGQRGAGRHTAGLCQRQQGRLGHLAALGRLRHERRGFDAGRRADPVLHRPGPAPAPAAVPYRLAGCRRTVSALLHAARQERKAALYPGRVDTTLPRLFECSPTVNVDRPKPCHFRAAQHTPPDPGPAPVPVRSPTVEQLLKRKILRRLRGRTSAFWAAPPATRGSRWSSSPPSRSRSRRRGVRGGRRTAPQCRPGLAAGGSHFSLGCRPCGPG